MTGIREIRPASKLGSELLFDVISQAYERTSIIVTTNLPFEQWTEVLDNERVRRLSRLGESSVVLVCRLLLS